MATSPIPRPTVSKSGGFQSESGIFTNFNDLYRFFQPKIMKVSKQSPPVLNVDITEGQIIWDRTLLRIYTVSDGVLRFVQFT